MHEKAIKWAFPIMGLQYMHLSKRLILKIRKLRNRENQLKIILKIPYKEKNYSGLAANLIVALIYSVEKNSKNSRKIVLS